MRDYQVSYDTREVNAWWALYENILPDGLTADEKSVFLHSIVPLWKRHSRRWISKFVTHRFPNAQVGSDVSLARTWEQILKRELKPQERRREKPNVGPGALGTVSTPRVARRDPQGGCPHNDFLSSDVSVIGGNPGEMEYRCVRCGTGEVVFSRGPFSRSTNNVGEFLGAAEAIRYRCEAGLDIPVYTDSLTAISWIRQRKCKTKLPIYGEELVGRVREAEQWMRSHQFSAPLKWETRKWGQVPADYGRK